MLLCPVDSRPHPAPYYIPRLLHLLVFPAEPRDFVEFHIQIAEKDSIFQASPKIFITKTSASYLLDPLLRLGEGGLGGRLGLQGLQSFQTERRTSHLRSPASTRALGRQEEHGRRGRRRSALPAPSRRRCPRRLSAPRAQSRSRAARTAGGSTPRPRSPAPPGPAAPRVPGGSERGGAGSSLSFPPSRPLPPPGGGARLPTKNNPEPARGVSSRLTPRPGGDAAGRPARPRAGPQPRGGTTAPHLETRAEPGTRAGPALRQAVGGARGHLPPSPQSRGPGGSPSPGARKCSAT